MVKEKVHDVNWAIVVACTTKQEAWKLEVIALKSKGIEMNGPHITRKFDIDEDLTKSHYVQEVGTNKTTYIHVKKLN
jgi:hypothetical protein